MGVESAQQIPDTERLTADVLDVVFIVLADSLADKVYPTCDSLPNACK